MSSLTDRVDLLFSRCDSTDSPGCMLAVVKDGEFLYKRGYGMADLERGIPITASSIFDIGSTGKQFTAAVIAILANQGFLGLDDTIRKYFPEMPVFVEPITIRHLIHHTSGLRDYLTLMDLSGMSDVNLYAEELLLELITRQKGLNFKPGSKYLYSNSGYFLLGVIAQRTSGKHITELIQEYILEPLAMKHTTFNKDYRPIVKDRALSYNPGEKEGTFVNALALCGGFGDGAILTSVEDLLLWDRNFYSNRLNNGHAGLIEQLHSTGQLNDRTSIPYAFGLDVSTYKNQRVVKHGGGWAGYRSEMMRFPEQCFTVICLSNLGTVDPTMLCHQVADIYLEDIFALPKGKANRPSKPSSAIQTGEFIGIYQNNHSTVELIAKEGVLHVSNGVVDSPLRRIGKKKFQLEGQPVFITFTGRHNEGLSMNEFGESIVKFKRVRNERFTPPDVSMYAGEYLSSELNTRYNLVVKEETLVLQRTPYDVPKPIHPFTENTFLYESGELRLQFKNGLAKGFILHAGRVTNIKFRKVT